MTPSLAQTGNAEALAELIGQGQKDTARLNFIESRKLDLSYYVSGDGLGDHYNVEMPYKALVLSTATTAREAIDEAMKAKRFQLTQPEAQP